MHQVCSKKHLYHHMVPTKKPHNYCGLFSFYRLPTDLKIDSLDIFTRKKVITWDTLIIITLLMHYVLQNEFCSKCFLIILRPFLNYSHYLRSQLLYLFLVHFRDFISHSQSVHYIEVPIIKNLWALPYWENPSCLQKTLASSFCQKSPQMAPHVLLKHISTRPKSSSSPSCMESS